MGFVNSLSGDFKNIAFESLSQTFVNGVVGPETWTSLGNLSGIFYVGSSADAIVSEKYRVDLAAVVLIDPEDLTFTIPESCRVTIDGEYYSVIHAEDVASEGKVIQIPVKRFS